MAQYYRCDKDGTEVTCSHACMLESSLTSSFIRMHGSMVATEQNAVQLCCVLV
jgi:hypothetical protein